MTSERKPGRRVRLADVAEEAGVAISTVSRALNNPDRVNIQTVEYVRAVAERLGYHTRRSAIGQADRAAGDAVLPAAAHDTASAYGRSPAAVQPQSDLAAQPNVAAVGIAPQPTVTQPGSPHTQRLRPLGPIAAGGLIPLIVKDTADGVSSQILKGAQVTAMESDSVVSVIETGSSPQRTCQMLDHLAGKVDGVILATDAPGTDFIRDYARRVPLVVLNRPVEGVTSVVPDPRIGVVRALNLLRRYHHTAVTYVSGPSASWANQSRWNCLHDIGQRMGFKVSRIGPVQATVEGGYQAAVALEDGRATAIVTYNDLIAAGIVLRLTADGVDVPGAMSVIGFDNTLIAPVVTPPITSIRIPRAQIGQAAVCRLLGRDVGSYRNPSDTQVMQWMVEHGVRCEEEGMPDVTLVDTSIIVRRSVGECRRA
ncbi:LacI family DNA-binding transcriptional regulator [Bifidobacterium leontopitheci]|uniref:Periplasmic binding protein-like domain-containing protein n=1 Tax=Bifidobacterium leontopitheci TaxID=2650774 RepID=A0A6I1GDB1_9BIFI|nr:LacI family DNA-binding transcriptional regulator [Bifidobacterium leontopitheci]KAB7789653.1 Periplasmic binding protein-like domain-containing protein [Bifidobacterium leontopitheci]